MNTTVDDYKIEKSFSLENREYYDLSKANDLKGINFEEQL